MKTYGHVSPVMLSLRRWFLAGLLLLFPVLAALAADISPAHASAMLPAMQTAKAEDLAKLKAFGYDFFAGTPASFHVAPDTAVPADYLLDARDVLRVRFWTPAIAETTHELTVNEAGTVAVPGIGDVPAAHLTIEQFRAKLGARLREQLKNPSFTADLITPRTIAVYVVGAAKRPGRYTVRADANLFNVVYAAGGAADEGSLRKIALKRNGKTVAEIDVYKFFLDGALGAEVRLEDQDTVFFPTAGARVTLAGQVARPGIYEIIDGTKIADVLAMAGGLKASAYARLLRLQRVEKGVRVERTLDAQAITRDAKHADNLVVQDGDLLVAESVSDTVHEKAAIRGNVTYPGNYALSRTPTAKALLNEARVKTGAYWERADLQRLLPDGTPVIIALPLQLLLDGKAADIPLQDLDEIIVYTTDERVITPLVTVDGAVKHAASYRLSDDMRVSDLLFAAGGLQRDAAGDVAHLYRREGANDYKILRISPAQAVKDAIQQGATANNPVLRDDDRLVIYSQQDVEYKAEKVAILGEVQRAGEYRVFRGLTLYDLVLQAGGPTDMAAGTVEVAIPAADGAAARTEVKVYPLAEVMGGARRDEPVQAGMLISLPRQGDRLARPRQVELKGQFRRPGVYALLTTDETLASVIERAGGFTDDGDPFGMSLTRDREKMLSNASAQQVKTIMDAMDQLLPPLTKAQGAARNSADVLDLGVPTFSPYNPDATRMEKVLLVSPRRLTGMPTSNRIGFTLEDRQTYIDRMGKVQLADGDVIEVPRKSQVVQVLGAVQSPGPVYHQTGYTANDFINRAGGGAPDADMKRAVVVKISGTVQSLVQTKVIDAGDVIVVPSKYQVVQPPAQRKLQDTLLNLLGVALVVRGLR